MYLPFWDGSVRQTWVGSDGGAFGMVGVSFFSILGSIGDYF